MKRIESKRKRNRVLVVSLIATFLGFTNLLAQSEDLSFNIQRPYFDLDYATFAVDASEKTRLEVYLQICNNDMLFVRKNGTFEASIEVSLILENNTESFFEEKYHKQVVQANKYEETGSTLHAQILQFDFVVSANEYELTARVMDSESKQTSERKLSLALPQYDVGSLGLSNIELCPEIEYANSSHDKELVFYKNGRWVVPRPNREYGVQENLLGIYFEIYGLTADEERPEGTFLLRYDIIDQNGNTEIDKTYRLDKPGKLAAISLNPSIEELFTGSYDLLVTVMDEETKRQTTHKTSFFRWSDRINVDKQNLSYSPDALRHIASSSELKRLKKTPSHEMAAALQTFWQSKDPTPNTLENEAYTDFYNRLTVANTAFGSKETPGWKTDQGGIFLRYGEPDIIYKDSYSQNTHKVEVWVYKSSGKNFVFVDRFGFGEFRLLRTLSGGY